MRRASACLAAWFLLGATTARADYKDDYRKGVTAIEDGKWEEGARLMRSALASQGVEGESLKLYGMRFIPYLPQYYLGLALSKTGDCRGAVQAWNASEGQGAIKKAGGSYYKELQKGKGSCETQLAESKPEPKPEVKPETTKTAEPTRVAETKPPTPDPAVASARQAAEAEIGRAQQAADRIAALSRESELAALWSKDAALGGKQKQALDQLAAARSKLDSGKDARAFGESRDLASRAARDLDAVQQEATLRKQRLAAQARPEKTPEARATALAAASGPAPAELVTAARAYFAGEYARAAETLARVDYPAGKAATQARLFRAAARYALFVTGGQTDKSLRQAALDDIEACRGLEPALVPDAQAFSPRFIAFYQKGR